VFIEAKDDGGDGDNWTTGNIFWQIASLPQHISFFAFFGHFGCITIDVGQQVCFAPRLCLLGVRIFN